MEIYDITVIGGGPVGLYAAFACARAKTKNHRPRPAGWSAQPSTLRRPSTAHYQIRGDLAVPDSATGPLRHHHLYWPGSRQLINMKMRTASPTMKFRPRKPVILAARHYRRRQREPSVLVNWTAEAPVFEGKITLSLFCPPA